MVVDVEVLMITEAASCSKDC